MDQAQVGGVCGDLTGDGSVDVFDAITLLQVIVAIIEPTAGQQVLGDLNQDELINVFDAITLLQIIVGLVAIDECGPPGPPSIVRTSPAHGEGGVAITRETIIEFSRSLDPGTVDANSVSVRFAGQDVAAQRRVSSDGKRVTIFYDQPLPPAARIRVTVHGDLVTDSAGQGIDADGDGVSGGTATIDFDTLGLTRIPGTEVFGFVFDSYNRNADGSNIPAAGVTISVDGLPAASVVTDENGFFRLTDTPAPVFFVHVDGSTSTSAPQGTVYATVGKAFHSIAGQSTQLTMDGQTFDIFLPPMSLGDVQSLSPTEDTEVGFGAAGKAELLKMFPTIDQAVWDRTMVMFPPNSAFDDQGNPATEAAIIPVPSDRLPAPLPPWVNHQLDIAVIAGGATNFDVPAAACFPNLPDPDTGLPQAPGEKSALWSFDHDMGDWRVTGSMTVSSDGLVVCTDPGVGIRAPGWHGRNPGSNNEGGEEGEGDGPGNGPEPGPTDAPPAKPCLPPKCEEKEDEDVGDPVYPFSGEFHESVTDLRIPGRGLDFEWSRKYRSKIGPNTEMGNGWDFGYNVSLEADDQGNRVLRDGNSRGDVYIAQADGSWSRAEFFRRLEERGDGTHTMTFQDGGLWVFNSLASADAPGKIAAISDRNGNTLSFAYDAQGRLSIITDTLGREVTIGYTADGFIASVTDFIGRVVQYDYYDGTEPGGSFGDLKSVTSPTVTGTPNGNDFPGGKTVSYTYSTGFADDRLNHNLLTITDGRRNDPTDATFGQGPYLTNIYDPTRDPKAVSFDRVVRQVWGDPTDILDFLYQPLSPVDANSHSVVKTIVNDRNGNVKELFYDSGNRLVIEREYTGRADPDMVTTQVDNRPTGQLRSTDPVFFETRYEWNGDSLSTRTVFPEGNTVETGYAADADAGAPARARGTLLNEVHVPDPARGGDQARIVFTRAYEPLYNELRTVTEPRGNDSAYVPQNGGANSPARYTTTYTYDYEESCDFAAIGAHLGRAASEVQQLLADAGMCGAPLGDVNGDGVTDQVSGNLIRIQHPTVHLLPGSNQAAVEGGTLQPIVELTSYNQFGQVVSSTDPEGNVTTYDYYPENDPDGDGLDLIPDLGTGPFGYLKMITFDTVSAPGRNSGTNPPPTSIRTLYSYDPVGNVTRLVDGRGIATDYIINELNQPVQIVRAAAHGILVPEPAEPGTLTDFQYLQNLAYDANNNVIRKETQNVDTNGPDLDGFVSYTYEYDTLDKRVSKSEEVSTGEILTTRYAFDPNENRVQITEPEGNVVQRVYDERDMVFTVTRGFGSPKASTQTMAYDKNRNRTRLLDAADNNGDGAGEEILTFFDGYDRPVRTLDAVGNEVRLAYDPASNVIRQQNFGLDGGPSPLDNSTTGNALLSEREMLFDELSRELQHDDLLFANIATAGLEGPLTPGDGKVTVRYEYDRNSRRTRVLDDNIHQRRSEYDGVDRVIRETDELNNEIAYAYDDNHNLIETVVIERSPEGLVPDETFTTRREYDTIDRLTGLIDNLGNRTAYAYDSRNNLIHMVDQLGNTTTDVYDGINRKLEEVVDLRVGGTGAGSVDTSNSSNPDGRITKSYDWDGNTRLVSLTDDNGNVTRNRYDALNRRTVETFADGSTNTYLYDGDDNVVTFTDENGNVHTNQFDAINRLTAKGVVRAAGVEGSTQWEFEYDGLSRRTRATDNNDPSTAADDSVVEAQYDSLSRRLVEIQNGKRIENVLDGVGNRLALTYPSGRVVDTTYDGLNRIDTIRNQAGGSIIAEYDYIGPMRTLERRYRNGTRLVYHDGAGQDIGYDGIRRVVAKRHETAGQTLLAGFTYAYDKENNRRLEVDLFTNLADVYEYDSAYRVTRAGFRVAAGSVAGITNNDTTNADVAGLTGTSENTYRLDGVGNWAERVAGGDATPFTANEMNEYATIDAITQTHDDNGNLTNDGSRRYFYDFGNRLVRVTDSSGAETGRYAYDALGRRIRKDVGGTVTSFFYDGARSLEERDGTDSVTNQYVFGRGIDEVLELTTAGQTYFYHDNSIGSVTALTDGAGAVVERYRYDPYGETTVLGADGTTVRTASTVGNPFRFTGRRFDDETELYYYRARFYDPDRGRFLQRDPMGYVDGMGLYEYAGSNPINWLDPYGMEKGKSWWDRGFGALQTLGGVIEIGVGAALIATGAGAPLGVLLVLHGADQTITGVQNTFGEEEHDSFTSIALQHYGMSKTGANLTDAGIGIVLTLGGSAVLKAPQAAAAASKALSAGGETTAILKQSQVLGKSGQALADSQAVTNIMTESQALSKAENLTEIMARPAKYMDEFKDAQYFDDFIRQMDDLLPETVEAAQSRSIGDAIIEAFQAARRGGATFNEAVEASGYVGR